MAAAYFFRRSSRTRDRVHGVPGRVKAAAAALQFVLLTLAVGCTAQHSTVAAAKSASPPPATLKQEQGHQVCGTAVLDSPFSYDGAPGKYSSGTAGLPTYGTPGSDFPKASAGVVLSAGTDSYQSYQLTPNTVYYLLPGVHVGNFQADANDAFVGGLAHGQRTVVSGEYSGYQWAFDSNYSAGDQPGVTIEYLTVEKYQPNGNAAAINQSTNTGWTLRYDTVTLNVPGAGAMAGANSLLEYDCLTLNGQYGFQSSDDAPWGHDSLTTGPYNVRVEHNEISYNDTCDFEGLINNSALGLAKYNPVPAQYRNPHCGTVVPDGDQGGFKLWETNGVTISDNFIHNNWGPGGWADTDNANTTYDGNVIVNNDAEAIIEEISYNFSISNNYIADNSWAAGVGNPGFPDTAIYISESGSPTQFGGIPPCAESSCATQGAYTHGSVISGNTLVNNGGGILLWQNSNRYCSSGFDNVCTLVDGGASGPFTMSSCHANLQSASIDGESYAGNLTGSPSQDWWDGCLWKTENVSVTHNTIDFDPAKIPHCTASVWPSCGGSGIFSLYGVARPYASPGGWVIDTQLTFFQGDRWSDNVYNGPSTFYAWSQGNGDNPVSWAEWTGKTSAGDMCGSASDHESGYCNGPFGQDSGSVYNPEPVSATGA